MLLRETNSTLSTIRNVLIERDIDIKRISTAVFDRKIGTVRVYAHCGYSSPLLNSYEAKLSEHATLQRLRFSKENLFRDKREISSIKNDVDSELLNGKILNSVTLPLFFEDEFLGFSFFDFGVLPTPLGQASLEHYKSHLALSLYNDLQSRKFLKRTVDAIKAVSNYRDNETGMHLDRMSRFARLIARKLSTKLSLSNDFIENVYHFSPLHDVGKIAISDDILFKPGRLTDVEFEEMKKHTLFGVQIIDDIANRVKAQNVQERRLLNNIVKFHHERFDGQGYPNGLAGKDIPLEARITTVADVFDALTSERPYKKAWSIPDTVAFFKKNSGAMFDKEIADTLIGNLDEVLSIKHAFNEALAA